MPEKGERLQKVMAQTGIASRRRCEELIASGMVKVNGKVVREQGLRVDLANDKIEVFNCPIGKKERKVYLMLYKPKGYLSSVFDSRGRKVVTDLLKGVKERVYPVGRLDYDSEGLLLLTNDGRLTFALTHPRYQVPKTYLALVYGVPSKEKLESMAKGLVLGDGPTASAEVRLLEIKQGDALIEVTVREGRNRLVRRMCESIGHPVKSLKRTEIGPLTLRGLSPGQYRYLKLAEIKLLWNVTGFL